MTIKFTQTLSADTVGSYVPPSYVQFFDGDSIIQIGRDCTLVLGAGWTDHNEAATALFNSLVDNVMPSWKEAVRAEQAAELAKYKALAETLAGALELADCALSGANMNMNVVERKVREALREYKEACDAS